MSNRVNLTLDVTKTGIQNPLIKVRQGDGGFETLRTTVTSNGEPLDLQGWTVTFMGTTAGSHKIVDDNVTVVEAPNGIFDYTPSKAWGMDIGEFKIAYFKFVKGDGSASSANFRVNVIEAVDLTQEEAQNYISIVDTTIAEAREHLENSLADVATSAAATSVAASSMAVNVSNVASSAVSEVNSAASGASSIASSAVANVNSAANSAVSDINAAAGTYVKKSGDAMTGGLIGGQVELTITGDLNTLTATGKYVQASQANAANWTNRPSNAPATAFSVDVIGSTDKSAVTQVYYANTTSRIWIRTLAAGGTNSTWTELANDANVVHNTGNEDIDGNKNFTGKVTAENILETGTPQSATATTTFNGLTFSFTRVGSSVYVTTGTSSVTTAIPTGWKDGIFPNGYRPISGVEMPFLQKPSANSYLSGSPSGRGYFNVNLVVGDKPRIAAYYPTTDVWPV